MEQTNGNGIKTWQWVVTVIVIIVLIVIGIMVFSSKGPGVPDVVTEQPSTQTAGDINRIIMSDQYPGNVVYVSSVQVARDSWIVIHKDAGGNPGAIIGEVFVKTGISPAKITLSESMIDGGFYYAILHSDDGDMKFDPNLDKPLVDAKGNIIMKPFRASVSVGAEIKG